MDISMNRTRKWIMKVKIFVERECVELEEVVAVFGDGFRVQVSKGLPFPKSGFNAMTNRCRQGRQSALSTCELLRHPVRSHHRGFES